MAEQFVQESEKEKEEIAKNPVQYYVKFSFMITYILLLTTATITFIEAMRTKTPEIRHVLNLETCISIVAGYFYSIFISKIDEYDKTDKKINWNDMTKTRYIDWSITTPLMLLTLCIVLGMNTNTSVKLSTYLAIVILNYVMLYFGYLGEVGEISRFVAMVLGFIAFFIMFFIIFATFVIPKYVLDNYVLYTMYLGVWGIYGIVYMFSEEYKNIIMNILDCIAKCLIGIGLWAYYTKIIRF